MYISAVEGPTKEKRGKEKERQKGRQKWKKHDKNKTKTSKKTTMNCCSSGSDANALQSDGHADTNTKGVTAVTNNNTVISSGKKTVGTPVATTDTTTDTTTTITTDTTTTTVAKADTTTTTVAKADTITTLATKTTTTTTLTTTTNNNKNNKNNENNNNINTNTNTNKNKFSVIEMAARWLSPQSAKAVGDVRTLIQSFPDHGVIDIFHMYPIKDVISSILTLSKLQHAVHHYDQQQDQDQDQNTKNGTPCDHNNNNNNNDHTIDHDLIEKLAHYASYANAAYGWRLDFAMKGRIRKNDMQTLLESVPGLADDDNNSNSKHKNSNILAAEWNSDAMRPAYIITRDRKMGAIVLCIRGTLNTRDVLTDLCADSKEFGSAGDRAHRGMLEGAECIAKETEGIIETALRDNPDYKLVLVGHSMGSGVASILGTIWKDKFSSHYSSTSCGVEVVPMMEVYGYGSPCVGPEDAHPTTSRNMISVVNEGDPFSCLSLGHVADVSHKLAKLCEDKALRNDINKTMKKSRNKTEKMTVHDLKWCKMTLQTLRSRGEEEEEEPISSDLGKDSPNSELSTSLKTPQTSSSASLSTKLKLKTTDTLLLPPGRIFYLSETKRKIQLREERSKSKFATLRLHSGMLDVRRHVPSLYESRLHEILKNMKQQQQM